MSSAVPSSPLPTAAYLNADRGSHVVAASIVLLILPTIVVGLRMTSRWMSKAGFWVCPCAMSDVLAQTDSICSGMICSSFLRWYVRHLDMKGARCSYADRSFPGAPI